MRDGWKKSRFADIFDLQMGKTPSRDNSSYWGGDNVWVSIADLNEKKYISESKEEITDDAVMESGIRVVPKNTVIMSFKLSIGKTAISTIPLFTNEAIMAFIEKDKGNLIPEFIYYYLKGYKWEGANKAVLGMTLNKKTISEQIFSYPSLSEQERIVAELDCLSSIIEKQKQQLKEYDTLAQSIFYDMFGDPIINEKGWEIKKLGAVCDIVCGQDYKAVQDDNGKYPIYGTGGIMGYASQYRCPANSIIIGRKGNINNPLFVDCEFWNVDTAFGVVPNTAELEPMYFFFFCKDYDFTKHDVSVTIPSLRRTDIIQINVPCPTLALQQQFAEKVEAIEKQKSILKKSIEDAELLFNSRMDYYFN